jgi:HSP20 family protein
MAEPKRAFSVISLRNHVRPSGRLWNPAADVYQGTEGWVVKIDLAGVCPEELELSLGDSHLIVRGCRRDTLYREGLTYQQMEITYSRFEKRVDFPCQIDSSSLKQEYRDGFLIVRLGCK